MTNKMNYTRTVLKTVENKTEFQFTTQLKLFGLQLITELYRCLTHLRNVCIVN